MNYYDDVNKIKLKLECLLLRALAFQAFIPTAIATHSGAVNKQLSRA
jgi:hypothetical protein